MRIIMCILICLYYPLIPMDQEQKNMIVAMDHLEHKNNCRQIVDDSNDHNAFIIIDLHKTEPINVEAKPKRCECTKSKAIIMGAIITACSAVMVSACGVIGVIIVALIKKS